MNEERITVRIEEEEAAIEEAEAEDAAAKA